MKEEVNSSRAIRVLEVPGVRTTEREFISRFSRMLESDAPCGSSNDRIATGCRIPVCGLGFRVYGSGFRVKGLGFKGSNDWIVTGCRIPLCTRARNQSLNVWLNGLLRPCIESNKAEEGCRVAHARRHLACQNHHLSSASGARRRHFFLDASTSLPYVPV